MTSKPQPATTTQLPPAGTYQITTHRSTVEFRTRHLFGVGAVRGNFDIREGRITVTDVPRRAVASVAVSAASFHTGNTNRDAAVLGPRLLDASKHPDILFTTDTPEIETIPSVVDGVLTVRGARHPLQVTVSDVRFNGRLSLQAAAYVDRYAYEVTGAKGLAGRWLHLDVNVVAERICVD